MTSSGATQTPGPTVTYSASFLWTFGQGVVQPTEQRPDVYAAVTGAGNVSLTLQSAVGDGATASFIATISYSAAPAPSTAITALTPTIGSWNPTANTHIPQVQTQLALQLLPVSSTSIISSSSSSSTNSVTATDATGQTSTTSVQSASVTNTPKAKQEGIASGPVAGIAIGCLVIGALLAGFAVFFCMKRRARGSRQRQSTRGEPVDREALIMTGPKNGWEKALPQPEADSTITRFASRTLDDIELFVENFYTDRPSDTIDSRLSSELLYFGSPHLARPLTEALQESSQPTFLIKHCLAYFLLSKIDPTRNDGTSLLPREYVVPTGATDLQRLSQLRVMMANSRGDTETDQNYRSQRDQAIATISQQIERAFQPWSRGSATDRTKNLRGILLHTSELGNKLFSQPADFEWVWTRSQRTHPSDPVMLPGLDKTTDTHGSKLASPIHLVQPRQGSLV